MARADPVREGLTRLADARVRPHSAESADVLRQALASTSNVLAARAAMTAGEAGLHDLVPDLEGAFQRFLSQPLKSDPACLAKTAIVGALAALGGGDETLIAAIRHLQPEPTADEPIDTAAEMRAAAIVALAERNHPRALELASELLADREPRARLGAITSFRILPSDAGAALLRYKALRFLRPPEADSQRETGDEIAETLATLLVCSPGSLGLVSGLLRQGDVDAAVLAAVAIGESSVRGALEALRGGYEARVEPRVRQAIVAAAGMLQGEDAAAFLLEVVARAAPGLAVAALEPLARLLRDPALRPRLAAAVRDNGSREVLDAFRRLPEDVRA